MSSGDEAEYIIPLQDQSVFGAGVRRRKINFVPSQKDEQNSVWKTHAQGIGDRYLSIVLSKVSIATEVKASQDCTKPNANLSNCEICRLPIESQDAEAGSKSSKPHEISLAHQVCLEHSHPPSHLDRTRQGLRYLSSYGWNPDARIGLGATGTGIRIPLKPKPKNDTIGLGLVAPSSSTRVAKPVVKKLDAKKTRQLEERSKRNGEKLRNMFYEREDVEKYLRSDG
ncbi:MAG: hypothetical protein Q9169_003300 [Polycauliona sp. 2 TL-2023]